MISTQPSPPDGPVTIDYQIGFWPENAYAAEGSTMRQQLGTWQGVLQEEDMASKAVYSSQPIMHRTYEISEAEAANFFQIVNRDKQRYREGGATIAAGERAADAQRYRYVGFNCKAWAMDVLKQVGVADANGLRNFMVQTPHSKKDKSHELNSEHLTCEEKDRFITENKQLLQNMLEYINSVEQKKEQYAAHFTDSKDQQAFLGTVDFIKQNVEELSNGLRKVGFDKDMNTKFEGMDNNLEQFLKIMEKMEAGEEKEALLAECATIHKGFKNNMVAFEGIVEGYKNNTVKFTWSESPRVEKRVNFKNFSDVEKARYLVDRQMSDMEAYFQRASEEVESKLKEPGISNDLRDDLVQYATIIGETNTELQKLKSETVAALQKPGVTEQGNLEVYIKKGQRLDDIMDSLERKVSNYEPKAEKDSGPIKRMLSKVISFFKKDYDTDPQKMLKKELKELNKANQTNKKRTKTFLFDSMKRSSVGATSDTSKKAEPKAAEDTTMTAEPREQTRRKRGKTI